MDLYRDIILDHYHHPRNFGTIEHADAVASDEHLSCGDRITIYVTLGVNDGKQIVQKIKFSGEGCAIDQASASLLTEKVLGMAVVDVMKLNTEDILSFLGTTLTPVRLSCALLPLEVLHKALRSCNQQ